MVNQQDSRPKFEEMSGFREISRAEENKTSVEKAEEYIITFLEVALELTDRFFLPLAVKFTLIYILFTLIFFGAENVPFTEVAFLILLMAFEKWR